MRKLADLITELKPHQQRVVERMRTQPGLVVAHGMGSGKTLTAIATAEDQGGRNEVLVPASLQTNFKKELAKHIEGTPKADYHVDSIQRAALKQNIPPSKLLTVDEAHRLRDPNSEGRKAVRKAKAEKRLLLTGTPTYNRPYDLASLVNVAAGENVFPAVQQEFDKRYIRERKVDPGWFARTFRGVRPGSVTELQNQEELGKHLGRWVDFHENTNEGFPAREDQTVQVQMHPKQRELYESVMGQAPAWVRYKVRKGLPPSKQESKDLNAFASAVRQISNSPGGFQEGLTPDDAAALSPKIQKAYERLSQNLKTNPQHRALVYSNFLDAGIHPYESLLKRDGVAYGKFTGDMPKSERDRMIADYNEGRLKALLLSSAGGEGLDLKGTRQIQVLEPHWNREKLEQVIARGIRYKSHEHLPEDQRRVAVEHYQSIHPEPGMIRKFFGAKRPGAIDEYLTQMSKDKDLLNSQVRDLLRQHAQGSKKKTAGLVELVARHEARLNQR